jgi:hypothetical protein
MTGSEADTERELEGEESGKADSIKLAKFLAPAPRPKTSAPPPPPEPARERVSLFSDLPVPRKNSSLRPPAAVTETPRIEAPRVEAEPAETEPVEAAQGDDAPTDDEETFGEEETPDDDFIPMSHAPIGRTSAKRVAIAATALVAVIAVVLVAKRVLSPTRATTPSTSASAIAEGPRAPAPREETLEPTDDPDLEPSAADPEKAGELRREARLLLEKGNSDEGVNVARRAIQADPNDAEGYILLAAGLQDLGRWQESRDVFAKCVQESNRKANAECVYFATRSK